jgi:tetratricopeptide (TPR) repeat protein
MLARDRITSTNMAQRTPGAVRLLTINGSLNGDDAAREAISRAWGLRFTDAHAALVWAELAVELAESSAVLALAHAHVGNTLRICGRLTEAQQELDLAAKLQPEPTATLLEFRASLLEELGEFAESLAILRVAGRLRAKAGDADGEARVLATKGHVLSEAGHHYEAAEAFQRALELVDRDADVIRAAAHGGAHALARCGQPYRALLILRETEPLFAEGNPLSALRVAWLLGRIGSQCKEDAFAIAQLEHARLGFEGRGMMHEVCLIALDLALHHTRYGRVQTAHCLLEPLAPLLFELGIEAKAEFAAALKQLLEGEIAVAVGQLDYLIAVVENRS